MLFISILIVLLFTCVEVKIDHVAEPQIYQEYNKFIQRYGNKALIISIFRNLYYFVETIIVLLIIALGWNWSFINRGLGHFLSHPQGAIYVDIWTLVEGLIYILSNKNVYSTFLVFFLMFIF
ncbi:MAG: hypothetical protein ACPLVD_09150 [Dictyoglomus turgidum]|uniref:hypothetical protein n=1 Tax=Dictyoglomus turgidum TaxID=513050 RepID=UPI003C720965